MKKTFIAGCALLVSLFLFSCQKEIELTDPSQTGSTGTGAVTRNSYFPLTKGSWWTYKDSLSGITSTTTATNVTRTFNNILYTACLSVMGGQSDTSWAASPQPNYYITAKGVSPSGLPYDILFHYLNDTASVGYNWQYTAGQGNGFTAFIKTSVLERGISMTVAGKSYTNVIHTRLELSYDVLGSLMDFGSYDYFTAKGVGLIKVRTELGIMGIPMMQTCSDLMDYSIK